METLKFHEKFEMETLDAMRSMNCLDKLVFGGGTMLRLCFNLPRYSVDMDFYIAKGKSYARNLETLKTGFSERAYKITDFQEKHFTYLIELRKSGYPRRLKIEVRKQKGAELMSAANIAYSPNSPNLQVRLMTCTLAQMWKNKIHALSDRAEIRDAYDLEFLLRRGAGDFKNVDKGAVEKMLSIVEGFRDTDYRNRLGNLLEADERNFYIENRFSLLKSELKARRN